MILKDSPLAGFPGHVLKNRSRRAGIQARAERKREGTGLLFHRTRRGFQRLVGNFVIEDLLFHIHLSHSLIPLVRQRRRQPHWQDEKIPYGPPAIATLNHPLLTV